MHVKNSSLVFSFLASIALALPGCGGGDGGGGTRPTTNGGGESHRPSVDTQFAAAQPEALHRAAGATPIFGSVSQGSNVRDGVATDQIGIAFLPDSDGYHPVATIRTGDGEVLTTNSDLRSVDPNVANNLYPIVGKSPISQDLVSIFDCRSDSPQVRLNSTAIPTIRSLK